MTISANKTVLGLGFLLLSLFFALPASAAVIEGCTGTLDAQITPGFTGPLTPHSQIVSAEGAIASNPTCAIVGTTVQPARLHLNSGFSSGSCANFTLSPGTTNMTITWDDNSTSFANYAPTSPLSFLLAGPFAAQFLISSGHAAGSTMSISAFVPVSAALLACLLPGATPVRHLGAPISFSVK